MFFCGFRAQSTIEYLVIIAIVIVVSLIAVGFLLSEQGSADNISASSSSIKQKVGSYGVSIVEAVIGSDENGLIIVKNSSGTDITVTKITIDGVDHNYSAVIYPGDERSLKLQNLVACNGEKKSYSVKIYYTTNSDLAKMADFQQIIIDCVASIASQESFAEEIIPDTTNPVLTLKEPTSFTLTSADTNVEFIFSANELVSTCSLYINDELVDSNSNSVSADTNISLDTNIALFGEGTHQYDINCSDASGNIGNIADSITYSPPDSIPPTITLHLPLDNNTITNADSNVSFVFSSSQDTNACYLYIEDDSVWNLVDQNLETISADTNYFFDANVAFFGEGDHYWDVNCSDTNGLIGTVTDRNINYTQEVVSGETGVNLLTNPGMETGDYTGWTASITAQTADHCTFSGLVMCIGGVATEGSYGVGFSYSPATLSQEIDLVAKGYSTNYLDSSPDINIIDHVIGYNNVSDYYRVKVELRNASHAVITSYNTGILTSNGSWATITNLFTGYSSGLRYIYFERYGDDAEFWSGTYGPWFDGASVTFVE